MLSCARRLAKPPAEVLLGAKCSYPRSSSDVKRKAALLPRADSAIKGRRLYRPPPPLARCVPSCLIRPVIRREQLARRAKPFDVGSLLLLLLWPCCFGPPFPHH